MRKRREFSFRHCGKRAVHQSVLVRHQLATINGVLCERSMTVRRTNNEGGARSDGGAEKRVVRLAVVLLPNNK